jgi:hypothetical protein
MTFPSLFAAAFGRRPQLPFIVGNCIVNGKRNLAGRLGPITGVQQNFFASPLDVLVAAFVKKLLETG